MANTPELSYKLSSLFQEYRDTSLLNRVETYALWTIPSLFPKGDNYTFGTNTNNPIEYDYQSIGALLVNRLATKLARTLFPANSSFFRIDITNEQVSRELKTQKIKSIIEYENQACRRIFFNASYAQIVHMMRLLIVTGECILHRVNNSLRVYSLKNYSAKRNNVGELLDLIICENKYFEELTPEIKALVGSQSSPSRTLKLYTRVKRQMIDGITSWRVTQEINGVALPTNMVYSDKLCPYIPVKWNFVNGDNYSRGYIEDYAADFAKLSDLSRELMAYEMESMRLLHMVNPQGGVDVDSLYNAATGEFVNGVPESVRPYEAGTYQKILEIRNDLAAVEARLNVAFMYSGNTRDAERVTAYELRLNAEEAEQVLGGVYSQLAEGLHLPLAYLLLNEVRSDIIAALEAKDIQLDILTGIQALSRNTENQGMIIACTELNSILPVVANLGKRYNIQAIAEKVFLSNGVDIEEITYTEEELQAQQQQEMQAAQAQQMAMAAGMQQQQLGTQDKAIDAIQNAQTL